jgi:hypothetical protein
MATPTSTPHTTNGTVTSKAILMGVNPITSIIMATRTTQNHIITAMSTRNITGTTSMSTPAAHWRFMPTRHKQRITRNGGLP